MADVPSILDGNEDLNMVGEQIVDMIAYVREYANTQMAGLDEAIENLTGSIGTFNPDIDSININLPAIDRPNFPIRPTFSELTLDESWPDTNIPEPSLQDYGILDFDYVVPTPPAEVDMTFSFSPDTYTSEMWQALFSQVHGALLSGDYGFPAAVYSALVAKEQEARRLNQEREYRSSMATVGAMGWNLPSGHNVAVLTEFQAEVLQKDQDALNNITIKDFEIANDWRKITLASAVDIERMLRDTFDKAQTISLEAAKATKEYIARFFSENVKLYVAKWEGVKLRVEALKAKIEAIASRNESETKVFISRAQVIESKVKAITEKNRGMVDVRKAEIELYATEVSAIRDEFLALVEEVKVQQNARKVEIESALKIEDLKLSAYTEKAKMAQTFSLGVAQIRAQGVASALGAINTSISNGYSASDSRSRQYFTEA